MRVVTMQQQNEQPHESIYTYAALIGIAAGWRYQSVAVGIVVTIAAAGAIYGHRAGYWQRITSYLAPYLQNAYAALLFPPAPYP